MTNQPKCSVCGKPAEMLLRKRNGFSAVCLEHYSKFIIKRMKRKIK